VVSAGSPVNVQSLRGRRPAEALTIVTGDEGGGSSYAARS